jgi:hypothetical protein
MGAAARRSSPSRLGDCGCAAAGHLCDVDGNHLAIALGYAATVLRAVGPDAIERVLSYVQMLMSFAVYGGQFVISGILSQSTPRNWTMPETLWLLLYPGTWFGSYLARADGQVSVRVLAPALASVAALALMASRLGGRLSLDYSERLGAMTVAAPAKAARAAEGRQRRGLWFATGEARAVRSGAVADPFSATRTRQGWPMAVLASPAMLRMLLTRSDAFRASWIFFTCPSDRMRIARSSKDVLVAFFLVPYLLVVAAIYSYVVGNVVHVLVHVTFLGMLAHLILQVALLLDPALPFSRPMQKGQSTSLFFGFTFVTVLVSLFIQFYCIHDVQQRHRDDCCRRRHRSLWRHHRLAHSRTRAAAGAATRVRRQIGGSKCVRPFWRSL